uniref:E3 ubiquitin-protein ligase NRDP1-like isoform X1 n=2 Tax=Oncorhynchus gorbuscha TaxID=8017 RepID=UPI001EAEEEBF|nr:E3 ubiquitin-protein ligase NRDP1-like isoform X1 [Oncorhynchus gorbuscha]XP_046198000.1 E3 ubiquitin-protein ligase NRDP1-like isoform X1 [Oncorhynchus gorbuscha]XP_046198005.1 E3 ubiquitin-protein ligase NRDP1-like isoform X1 [Oncorhynchus gorbuscha]XP_046198006.1 E3 ubiquitin-protein ligase NRDP1-like isoform X1 [Oncorhynchus gorbuscha]
MGYDVTRFQGEVDEDLLCPICSGVLEEPVQAPHCEHAFCNACITQWFSQQQICPVDRSVVTLAHLRPVPRIMRNMLSKLQITCDNAGFGCTAVLRLDQLQSHLRDCQHNPKRPFQCEQGCGLEMPKDEVSSHNCIKHLRSVVQQQQGKVTDLDKTAAEHKHQLAEQKRDIQLLKAYMRAIRSANPNLQNLEETIEYNEILEWVNSLQPVRVTRWGGMISTPDAVLQAVIKRSLIDSGCPLSIVNDLIENAHERNWPAGLATLETRQMNRRYYENYVAKRIPGKQAVVVMACENQHMDLVHPRDAELIRNALVHPRDAELIRNALVHPRDAELIRNALVHPRDAELIRNALVHPRDAELIRNVTSGRSSRWTVKTWNFLLV